MPLASVGEEEFQSAPLTEARGDHHGKTNGGTAPSFNPLPSPKQGETPFQAQAARELNQFQSAPLTEARGDFLRLLSGKNLPQFQSAPLTEARGDRRICSIRSGPSWTSFNPLPSPKQGETKLLPLGRSDWRVSIRSPHRSKGRLHPRHRSGRACAKFQSAPLTEARGDSTAFRILCLIWKFQSAPLTEARGDMYAAPMSSPWAQFQSAPLTEARGDRSPSQKIVSVGSFQSAPLTEARGDDEFAL